MAKSGVLTREIFDAAMQSMRDTGFVPDERLVLPPTCWGCDASVSKMLEELGDDKTLDHMAGCRPKRNVNNG